MLQDDQYGHGTKKKWMKFFTIAFVVVASMYVLMTNLNIDGLNDGEHEETVSIFD